MMTLRASLVALLLAAATLAAYWELADLPFVAGRARNVDEIPGQRR